MQSALPPLRLAAVVILGSLVAASAPWPARCAVAAAEGSQRDFTIHAHKYSYEPVRLVVQRDDLVKITLVSDDIAHSLTVDAYRIARRVGPGQTTVFEFRADQAGTFPFYCNLTADERCKEMQGQLVVTPR
jgi:heme/copper-type cytochrome/quinol oxidase subunit 2